MSRRSIENMAFVVRIWSPRGQRWVKRPAFKTLQEAGEDAAQYLRGHTEPEWRVVCERVEDKPREP